MIHQILPTSKTTNELGAWIAENAIAGENRTHEERIKFTKEEIAAFEHASAIASRHIDRLKAISDMVKKYLKEGVPVVMPIEIPVTDGIEVLEANRKFACEQLERGYRTDITKLYAFPWPEKKKITYVDIEGNHWEQYDHAMNPIQERQYEKPLLSAADQFHKGLADGGMKVTGVDKDTNTIHIETGGKKKKNADESPEGNPSTQGPSSFIDDQDGPLFDSK